MITNNICTCKYQNAVSPCNRLILHSLLTILILSSSCTEAHDQQTKAKETRPEVNLSQKGTPPTQYIKKMESARLQRLREKMPEINLGDSEDYVIEKIGPPDEVDTVGPKQSHGREASMRVLVYDVKLVNATRGNTWDKTIELWFDFTGRLVAIESNVEGIERRADKKEENRAK